MHFWSSDKRTELLAWKIKFPEMRSTERWGGERRGRGRGLEDSCLVLFANPSLASIVRSSSLHSGFPGALWVSTEEDIFFCLCSLPHPPLPPPTLLPLSSPIQRPASAPGSNITSHLLSPRASIRKSVWTYLTPPFPDTLLPILLSFSFATSTSTPLLKDDERQVRKPGHCDIRKISLCHVQLLKHMFGKEWAWEADSNPDTLGLEGEAAGFTKKSSVDVKCP